jgi:hypothetical protein
VTVPQLVEVARTVARELREAGSHYQALSVGFYDYPEYVGFGYVMGSWDHAPYGDWSQAAEATLGEYDIFEETSNLRSKDWSQRPTPEQVDIWFEWEQALAGMSDLPDIDDEEEAYDRVASSRGISSSDVIEAVDVAAFWPFQ